MTISKEALEMIRNRGRKLISKKMAEKFKNTGMAGALEDVFIDTLIIKAGENCPEKSADNMEQEWQKNVNDIIDWIQNPMFTLKDFLEFAQEYDDKIDKKALEDMLKDVDKIKAILDPTKDKHAEK